LALAGTGYVEMAAVMAKHNPFRRESWMKKIMEQPPQEDALKIAMVLEKLGFNIQLLGSENCNFENPQSLKTDDVELIREAFSKCNHPPIYEIFFRSSTIR